MILILASLALMALMLCFFRTLVISRHSSKFVDSMVWRLDVGARWAYPAYGLILLAFSIVQEGFTVKEQLMFFVVLCAGTLALWTLPQKLAPKL